MLRAQYKCTPNQNQAPLVSRRHNFGFFERLTNQIREYVQILFSVVRIREASEYYFAFVKPNVESLSTYLGSAEFNQGIGDYSQVN